MTFNKLCILGLTLVVMASCHVSSMKDYEFLRGPTYGIAENKNNKAETKSAKFLSLKTDNEVINTAADKPPEKFRGLNIIKANASAADTLITGKPFYISVYREPDLSDIFITDREGALDYPLIGKINVKDLSPDKIAALITEKLKGDYLINPHVIVQPVNICLPENGAQRAGV